MNKENKVENMEQEQVILDKDGNPVEEPKKKTSWFRGLIYNPRVRKWARRLGWVVSTGAAFGFGLAVGGHRKKDDCCEDCECKNSCEHEVETLPESSIVEEDAI